MKDAEALGNWQRRKARNSRRLQGAVLSDSVQEGPSVGATETERCSHNQRPRPKQVRSETKDPPLIPSSTSHWPKSVWHKSAKEPGSSGGEGSVSHSRELDREQ